MSFKKLGILIVSVLLLFTANQALAGKSKMQVSAFEND